MVTLIRHRFSLVRIYVPKRTGFEELLGGPNRLLTLQIAKHELRECLDRDEPTVVLSIGWPYLLNGDVLHGPWKCFNCHPSLLPKYRGVSVFYHMLVNQEQFGGATLHEIDEGMDTGRILLQKQFVIDKYETWRSLQYKSEECRTTVVLEGLELIQGEPKLFSQDHSKATVFVKARAPSDSEFDPSRTVLDVFDHIKACDEQRFPAFFRMPDGTEVCIKMWRRERPSGAHEYSL